MLGTDNDDTTTRILCVF